MNLDANDFYQSIINGDFADQKSLFKKLFVKDGNKELILKYNNTTIRLVGNREEGCTNAGSIEKQSNAVHALIIEDTSNILDEGLNKEWVRRGSVKEELLWSRDKAIEEFFGLTLDTISAGRDGKSVDTVRKELSNEIGYVKVFNPDSERWFSYAGITVDRRDYGRGVIGSEFVNTFLSLERGNNLHCRFVIGKYGFGAASRFDKVHVGNNGYTLIVSISETDPTKAYFTLVFAKNPSHGAKIPQYYFLKIDGEIPYILASESSLGTINDPTEIRCGSLLRTYNAQLAGPLQRNNQNIKGLRYKLSNYFAGNLISFRVKDVPAMTAADESKKEYEKTYVLGRVVNANLTRIQDKRNDKLRTIPLEWYREIELPFPNILKSPIWENRDGDEGTIKIYISLFPYGKETKIQFCEDKDCGSIILDGLKHADLSKNIVEKAGHSYLSKYLLVVVDVSGALDCQKNSMFMSNRENESQSDQSKRLRELVIDYISSIQELKEYNVEYGENERTRKREVSGKALEKLFSIFAMGAKKGSNSGNRDNDKGAASKNKMSKPKHDILPINDSPEILRFVNSYEKKPKIIIRDGISSATVETDIAPSFAGEIYAQIEDIMGNMVVPCKVSKIDKSRLTVACLGKGIDN